MLEFWNDSAVEKIINAFAEGRANAPTESFNLFSILSTHNNKELFHSDVIAAFLDPKRNHFQGDLFLTKFIQFLNVTFNNVCINPSDYAEVVVDKEFPTKNGEKDGRIDILVHSSTHCIIIENKMHDAVDQEEQLQRYYDYMTSHGLIVDAIVYLPLDRYKRPSVHELENERAKRILCIVPAYIPGDTGCLVNGWILPCAEITTDTNCSTILKQYANLIMILNRNNMDVKNTTDLFENLRISNSRWESAVSLKQLIDSLPELMSQRLYECERLKSKCNETRCEIWKGRDDKNNNWGFTGFKIQNDKYHIDVWTSLGGYDIYIFEVAEKTAKINCPSLTEVPYNQDGYKLHFLPVEEENVILIILKLLDEFNLL